MVLVQCKRGLSSDRRLSNCDNVFYLHFRDLTLVRAEVNKSARTIQSACIDLDRVQRGTESNVSAVLERERSNREKVTECEFDAV